MTSSSDQSRYAGRSRDFMRQEVAARIASVDSRMVVLQHAGHQALFARDSVEVRHWLGHAARAAELLTAAADDASEAIEALGLLFPAAHVDDGDRPARCTCGRRGDRCPARVQLEDGYRQWVDEQGRVRSVVDPGSEAIPASQR